MRLIKLMILCCFLNSCSVSHHSKPLVKELIFEQADFEYLHRFVTETVINEIYASDFPSNYFIDSSPQEICLFINSNSNDNDNKVEYLGGSVGIFFRSNFQESGVIPEKISPSLFANVTNCD